MHTEKICKKLESQSADFFPEETYVFLALLDTGELRKTSRDSLSASREARAHRKLSKDKTANTFPFTEGSGRAGACAELPWLTLLRAHSKEPKSIRTMSTAWMWIDNSTVTRGAVGQAQKHSCS